MEWRHAHFMYGHEMMRTTETCANHDDQNLTTGLCAHGISRASIHVSRSMCAVWKVLRVLVVTLSLFSGFCSPIVHL